MDTSNPVFFLIDMISGTGTLLSTYSFLGVDLMMWFIGFIIVNMVVSVFWRGARG